MHRTLRPLTLAAFAATTVAAHSPVAAASPTAPTEAAATTPAGPATSDPTTTSVTAPTESAPATTTVSTPADPTATTTTTVPPDPTTTTVTAPTDPAPPDPAPAPATADPSTPAPAESTPTTTASPATTVSTPADPTPTTTTTVPADPTTTTVTAPGDAAPPDPAPVPADPSTPAPTESTPTTTVFAEPASAPITAPTESAPPDRAPTPAADRSPGASDRSDRPVGDGPEGREANGLPATVARWWTAGSWTRPVGLPIAAFQLEAFPVLGPVRYSDGWGLPRGEHGERRHEGTDILGVRGQPLRAAFDGIVSRYQLEDGGISGAAITITRADGVRANYFHVNTDDLVDGGEDAAPTAWRIPAAVQLGSVVSAGQIIGFMGDSGNAVSVPHLHFEVRTPDGVPFDAFPALREAEARETCAPAFGPWANVGASPDVPLVPVVVVRGLDGAVWQLTSGGEVMAPGSAGAVGQCGPR